MTEEKFEMLLINLNENAVTNEWQINDQMISDESQAIYNYKGLKEIQVQLLVSDTLGCQNSTSQLIKFNKSGLPKANPILSCKNQPVIIKPSNGKYFLFYDQSELKHPIYKGSAFNLGHLKVDQEIYITSIDQFLESDPISVNITIDSLEAIFEIEPLLNLSSANQVSLTNQSLASDHWDWIVDGIHYGALPDTSWIFERPGHHEIGLLVSNQQCVDTLFQDLEVVEILGLENEPKNTLVIYPNPTRGHLWIKNDQFKHRKIEVFLINYQGEKVWSSEFYYGSKPIVLDISNLNTGLYLIGIRNSKNVEQHKVLLIK